MYAIIDIGGTNTRVAFSGDLQNLVSTERYPTPKTFEEAKSKLALQIDGKQITAAVVGLAGHVDSKTQHVIFSPHMDYLDDKNISELMPANTKTFLENDAALAGLGESISPYAKDYTRVAYITISTGVGGTLIVNKSVPEMNANYEPGHIVIDKSSTIEPVDSVPGSWESLCSGTAFEKIYNIKPEQCMDTEIWHEYGRNLAYGLLSVSLLWRPEIIVIGGSVTNKWNLFIQQTEDTFVRLHGRATAPKLTKSELGEKNGLLGGMFFLRNISQQ